MFKRFKEQKGAVAVMAAIITVVLMGFTSLAVDVGVLVTSRTQLQSAADSAALAAASRLSVMNYDDVISTAKEYANYNKVMDQSVVLQDSDIQIFDDPDAALRRVRVTAYRTSARGNPINLLFAKIFGYSSVDMTATSMAGLIPVDGAGGLRPWAVRDICLSEDDDDPTGCADYGYPVIGELVMMKYGAEDDRTEPHWFGPVSTPPVWSGGGVDGPNSPIPGANAYRDNIINGAMEIPEIWDGVVEIGDVLRVESGNMAGPTRQGVDYLMSLDPLASWDSYDNQVTGSSYPDNKSPRIVKVLFFDPNIGIVGSPGEITVTRMGAFFLEGVDESPENNVMGRFVETLSSGKLDINSPSRVFGVGLLE
ncbi:MAG: pilus assembly protein TadG-related protein [Candidatus Brocadiales bacterium]